MKFSIYLNRCVFVMIDTIWGSEKCINGGLRATTVYFYRYLKVCQNYYNISRYLSGIGVFTCFFLVPNVEENWHLTSLLIRSCPHLASSFIRSCRYVASSLIRSCRYLSVSQKLSEYSDLFYIFTFMPRQGYL